MDGVLIEPRACLDAAVRIPGSKSCTARALVMAGMTRGASLLMQPADCDDTARMIEGLDALGAVVKREDNGLRITGGGLRAVNSPVFLGNSGTAMRFLTACCGSIEGRTVLDGNARMRERPIGDLLDALRDWGVRAHGRAGIEGECPPVVIEGSAAFGGEAHIRGSASSQYLSGLLMVAPAAKRETVLRVEGELVSKPYIDLTLGMMAERGVRVENDGYRLFRLAPGQDYAPGVYEIEADASGASYFFAAAAVAGGRVRVTNLGVHSAQGDAQFPSVLARMGCIVEQTPEYIEVRSSGSLRGIDIDMNAMPDMAQTLAVTALFADGPTTIRNVANLRIKECDRISATAAELRKLGAHVDEQEDGLRVVPGTPRPARIGTYDDHRMAMSFALAGLRIPGVVILEPDCVAKTFPDFFERFGLLR